MCDVSTLGKIDLQGPDAGAFLDRLYVNAFSTLPVGKARYGIMLREDGFVMDDGTASRLADDRYIVTTTTANAPRVLQHLEFCHQCLWPDLDVQFVSVALPYLAAGELTVCGGVAARLFRLSFSGELAYELAVPARFGDALVRRLLREGEAFGVAPYGTEAMGVMRIEKGHVAGSELNGQTTARDLGLARMMSTKKDFIGRFMAGRPALLDPDRPTEGPDIP